MITVVGIGPGSPDLIFERGKQAIVNADYVIGSERQLEIATFSKQNKKIVLPKKFVELKIFLTEHMDEQVALLASGDPLTYGIGNWINKNFPAEKVQIIPGISSIHYLFNRANVTMENCFITSSHGKTPDFDLLFSLPKVGLVTDEKIGPYQLAQEAIKRGLNKHFLIGESLSYPEEKLRWFTAETVPDETYQMNVVVIVDER